ncbi:unnamed protein product [Amoebophrya sp. A25]|nr:unnamed protein product [Amoebophrya sp. A25]|eukprot:GSA25T00007495001.1
MVNLDTEFQSLLQEGDTLIAALRGSTRSSSGTATAGVVCDKVQTTLRSLAETGDAVALDLDTQQEKLARVHNLLEYLETAVDDEGPLPSPPKPAPSPSPLRHQTGPRTAASVLSPASTRTTTRPNSRKNTIAGGTRAIPPAGNSAGIRHLEHEKNAIPAYERLYRTTLKGHQYGDGGNSTGSFRFGGSSSSTAPFASTAANGTSTSAGTTGIRSAVDTIDQVDGKLYNKANFYGGSSPPGGGILGKRSRTLSTSTTGQHPGGVRSGVTSASGSANDAYHDNEDQHSRMAAMGSNSAYLFMREPSRGPGGGRTRSRISSASRGNSRSVSPRFHSGVSPGGGSTLKSAGTMNKQLQEEQQRDGGGGSRAVRVAGFSSRPRGGSSTARDSSPGGGSSRRPVSSYEIGWDGPLPGDERGRVKQLEKVRSQLVSAESEVTRLKRENTDLQTKYSNMEVKFKHADRNYKECAQRGFDMQTAKQYYDTELEDLANLIDLLVDDQHQLKDELGTHTRRMQEQYDELVRGVGRSLRYSVGYRDACVAVATRTMNRRTKQSFFWLWYMATVGILYMGGGRS